MKNSYIFSVVCAVAVMCFGGAVSSGAQERSASGSMDTQVTWTALSNLAKAANDKADMVGTRVDQIVVCGKKNMIYAPGAAGADAQGCVIGKIEPSVQNNINNIIACANSGQMYSSSSNQCVRTTPTCTMQTTDVNSIGRNCPAGYVFVSSYTGQTRTCSDCNEGYYSRNICARVVCN